MDIHVIISINITLVTGGNRLTPWGTLLLEETIAPHLIKEIFLLRSSLAQSCSPVNMAVDIQVA
jgi:hypothetical protein